MKPTEQAAWSALLATAIACGPEVARRDSQRYAETFCASITQCDCAPRWDDADACERDVLARMETLLDQDGVHVDRECFDRGLERMRADPCATPGEWWLGNTSAPVCAGVVSDRDLGEPCAEAAMVPGLAYWPCSAGTHCSNVEHVCVDLLTPLLDKDTDDSCDPTLDFACNLKDYCNLDGVCQRKAIEGEPCSDYGCEPGLYCAGAHDIGEGVCARKLTEGEACDPEDFDPCDADELDCNYTTRRCAPVDSCRVLELPLLWR